MADTRERILEGAYDCVARLGMTATTMDEIARAAGVSRATVYRVFPGGRDEVLDAVVTWEVARFFGRVGDALGPDRLDVPEVFEAGLVAAHEALAEHAVLQNLLRTEADQLLPPLATTMPLVKAALADWIRPRLEATPLRPEVDAAEAADVVARMVLSYLGTPGRWDLGDPVAVRRLVRRHLLAGIVRADHLEV